MMSNKHCFLRDTQKGWEEFHRVIVPPHEIQGWHFGHFRFLPHSVSSRAPIVAGDVCVCGLKRHFFASRDRYPWIAT